MDIGRILDGTPEPPSFQLPSFSNPRGNEYFVPVRMTEFQHTLYNELIDMHQSDILKFTARGKVGESTDTDDFIRITNSLNKLYNNTKLLGTHPYLLVDHYLPPNLLLRDIPSKLSRASGKFMVLVNIVNLIRDKRMQIALISRPGKSFDIIEALLLGKMINYERHSGSPLRPLHKSNPNTSTIHLLPSSQLDSTYTGHERFDLVIALDQTFNSSDPHIMTIRSQSRTTQADLNGKAPKFAPILRLVPYYSSEHIFSQLHNEFLKNDISAVSVLRPRVGEIPKEFERYYSEGLNVLLPWFENMNSPWPLAENLPEISIYNALDVEHAINVYKGSTDKNNSNGVHIKEELSFPDSDKDEEVLPIKRLKTEEASTDKFIAPITALQPLDERRTLTARILRCMDNTTNSIKEQTKAIQILRTEASERETEHEDLIESMRQQVEKIYKLNDQVKQCQHRSEREDMELSRMQEAVSKQEAELVSLRGLMSIKKRQEDDELTSEAARELLKLEDQKTKIAGFETDLEKLQTDLATKNSDNDTLRVEYQKISSEASELAEKVVALQSQNKNIDTKLATNIVDLKTEAFASERNMKERIIMELEIKLRNVEEHLKRVKESEKVNQTRSRYSVRVGGINRRKTKSPTNSSNSSRRGSPATNHGPHPLQNMTNSH